MSSDTDAYEVDPQDYRELGHRMDHRQQQGPFNGSTKIITSLLALMNILTAAAIVGGIVMYGRVEALDSKVDLIITGHIKIASGP
jgi:hypothetical protein